MNIYLLFSFLFFRDYVITILRYYEVSRVFYFDQ